MPSYTVKQGDHLSKIAEKNGFGDYRALWDHPQNSQLKQKRENPNVLYPGDVLYVPEKECKDESGATEQRHRFRVHSKNFVLRIVLKDFEDEPVADAGCQLHLEGKVFSFRTDAHGRIEQTIPSTADGGVLIFDDPAAVPFDERIHIKIGHLDPVDTTSGIQARLNNLGYDAGPVDGNESEQIRSAIEEFQCDTFKIASEVDGKCGPNTQSKLKKVHGC